MNLLLHAIYWILPAYVANGMPTLFGGGTPIDLGKSWNGKRILGDGKTIRGTIIGIIFGSLVGFLVGSFMLGVLLSTGALLGDLVSSFFKRQAGLERGHPLWIVDQMDFLAGALLLAALVEIPEPKLLLTIIVITPLIHISTNFLAYKLKLKKVWW